MASAKLGLRACSCFKRIEKRLNYSAIKEKQFCDAKGNLFETKVFFPWHRLCWREISESSQRGAPLKAAADEVLDLRDSIGPVALLEFTKVFRELLPNQVLEILVGDIDLKNDLFKVLKAFSYEIINIDEQETFCRIWLRKQ